MPSWPSSATDVSVEAVRRFFHEKGLENEIIEFEQSSATVDLAARRLGVAPGLIAKTWPSGQARLRW